MLLLGISGSLAVAVFHFVEGMHYSPLDGVLWCAQCAALLMLCFAPLPDDLLLNRVVLGIVAFDLAADVFVCVKAMQDAKCGFSRPQEMGCFIDKVYDATFTFTAIDVSCFFGILLLVCCLTADRAQSFVWAGMACLFIANVMGDLASLLFWAISSRRCDLYSLFCLLGDSAACFIAVHVRLRERIHSNFRRMFQSHQSIMAAAGIASLVGDVPVKLVLAQASNRFRCVRLSDLTQEEIADNSPNPALVSRTRSVQVVGRIAAFISHSWHDDAIAKWNALQTWTAVYRETYGKEPDVWFDKCCIDQNNIEVDLRCLPIFLTGCEKLVVLCGATYLKRLWCVMEIFTFVHMGGSISEIVFEPLLRQ